MTCRHFEKESWIIHDGIWLNLFFAGRKINVCLVLFHSPSSKSTVVYLTIMETKNVPSKESSPPPDYSNYSANGERRLSLADYLLILKHVGRNEQKVWCILCLSKPTFSYPPLSQFNSLSFSWSGIWMGWQLCLNFVHQVQKSIRLAGYTEQLIWDLLNTRLGVGESSEIVY